MPGRHVLTSASAPSLIFVLALSVAQASALSAAPVSADGPEAAHRLDKVSPSTRQAYIERAQVWRAVPTASLDLGLGPPGEGAFPFDATVECEFVDDVEKKLGGMTPKFLCRAGEEVLRVRYGEKNGEVYADTAASRLFWALGFGTDAVYPVQVLCRRCPVDPWWWKTAQRLDKTLFRIASIERKFPGEVIESKKGAGWRWSDLDSVDPAKGGAPVAHRDALKLLAVFVQHGDNKPGQQRLVCLPEGVRRTADEERCERPFLIVSDLGATFGGAGNLSRAGKAKLNFAQWSSRPVFRDPARCVGALNGSFLGDLQDPVISEAGRRFLAEHLSQLSDRQIEDLFTVARADHRRQTIEENGAPRPVTVRDWTATFKRKRAEVMETRCPE